MDAPGGSPEPSQQTGFAPLREVLDRIDTASLGDAGVARLVDELQTRLHCNGHPDGRFRMELVDLMNVALELWQRTTQQTKIDLAQRSRIWSVSQDDGRLRTRTLDRYLRVDRLPRVPRWREVVRTAYFVLAEAPLEDRQVADLEARIDSILRQSTLR